jgi:hypothetical protein
MSTNLKQFNHLKHVTLSPEEKERLRAYLHEYMALKPRREMATAAPKRDWSWVMLLGGAGYRALAVLIAISVSGGVVLASEDSLPGDVLYPVKTSISENVREALVTSPAAQARLQSRLLDRRVAEAKELSEEDRLTPQVQAVIETNIAQHVAKAQRQLAKIESTSLPLPEDLLEVKGTVLAHGQLLAYGGLDGQLKDKKQSTDEEQVSTLLFSGDIAASSTISASSTANESAALSMLAEDRKNELLDSSDPLPVATYDRLQRAEEIITSSQEMYDEHAMDFDNITRFDLNHHLREARDYRQDGNEQFFAGEFERADYSSRQAIITAQEAKTFIAIKIALLKKDSPESNPSTAATTTSTTVATTTDTTATTSKTNTETAEASTTQEVIESDASEADLSQQVEGRSESRNPVKRIINNDFIRGLKNL